MKRAKRVRLAAIAAACVLSALQGCASSTSPKKACLSIETVDTLNLYDGQPHALTLYIYPLSSTDGFEQADADEILSGARPVGVLAPPIPITIEPGDLERSFQDLFPIDTHHLGVIADYYRGPNEGEGIRKQVVPARCSILKPKLLLTSNDLLLD